MRFSIIILLASAVSGMSLHPRQSDLPDCAMTCIQSADASGCSSTDQTCLCKSSAFVNSSAACFQSTCSADELNTAVQVAEALCKSVGVTVDVSLSASSGTATATSDASTSTASDSASTTSGDTNGASTFSLSLTPLALVGVVMAIIM